MEKRRFERIENNLLIWYQTLYENGDFSFGKTTTNNISLGGLQIETESIDAIGTELIIKLEIPDIQRKIAVKGTVVWVKKLECGKYRIGLEFPELKDEDQHLLKEHFFKRSHRI